MLYVLRSPLPDDGAELRYSLRSLVNVEHARVWEASAKRPELLSDEVGHVQLHERANDKWTSIPRAIMAACQWREVGDRFLLMNDDFFVMRRHEGAFPMLHRGAVSLSRSGVYGGGFVETSAVLRRLGVEGELLNYELHAPMPVDAALMAAALLKGLAGFRGGCLHARTLYGNLWAVGGEQRADAKVYGRHSPFDPEAPLLSTSDVGFGRGSSARRAIEAAFPDRCDYERN